MFKNKRNLCCGLLLTVMSVNSYALENGSDSAALGAEGTMAGNLPPKGVYLITYYQNYHADKMLDQHGNISVPDFHLDANALVARLVWMTDQKLLGGQLGFYGIQPFVDVRLSAAGFSDSNKGLGDFVFAPLLAWHHGNHHWGVALENVFPTGDYDKNSPKPVIANISKNYYTFRPMFAYSYMTASGWDLSTKMSYSINEKNDDTHYKSGDYFAFDYNLSYQVRSDLTLGLQGYALKQFTDDKRDSVKVQDSKAQVLAYGPAVSYHPSRQWFLEGKYLFEDQVENRAKGGSTWLKFVWSF